MQLTETPSGEFLFLFFIDFCIDPTFKFHWKVYSSVDRLPIRIPEKPKNMSTRRLL